MRKVIQFICGAAVILAFGFSWLFTLTFLNRVTIYHDREKYRPGTYVVTGAEYVHETEGGDTWWLTGTVTAREERFIPRLAGASSPRSAEDLLARYPKGTKIDVLYNPDATDTIMQGETLRVFAATPDFWQNEAKLRHRFGLRVLVPVPVTLAIYLTVRYVNRRHAKLLSPPNATRPGP
jgi:hypothetical protein